MDVDPSDPSYSTQLEAEKKKVSAEVPPPFFLHAIAKLTKCKLFLFQWAALIDLSGPDCLFGSEASSLTVSYECSQRPKIELCRIFRGNTDEEISAKLNMDDVTMCPDGTGRWTMRLGRGGSLCARRGHNWCELRGIGDRSHSCLPVQEKQKKKTKEGKKSALKFNTFKQL